MTIYLDVITAIPKVGNGDKALARQNFVKRYAYCLDDSEDLRTITVVDPDYGVLPLYVIQQRRLFQYDSTDTTTAHDGTTCLVSADGKRYKIDDFLLPWAVLSKTLTAPPGSPAVGDSYIVAAAATGAWSGHDNAIATYTSRSWLFLTMPVGKPVYNEGDGSFYYRNAGGTWTRGAGNLAFAANSVTLSNIIGVAASLTIRVENQTTNTPPGSRITGGTPTAPLGGTAANANDDNISTTVVTSGLGDLSAASVASRIIAKIDYGSNKSLTAIEAKQLKLSTGTGTAGLYYSTDGTSWTKLSTDLSLTSSATDFIRTGSVTARYVAVILAQANYSTATSTLGDLNGYDSTIVVSVGTAYIVGSAPFGPWAGLAGKVLVCEIANTFTTYTPATGDEVFDKSLGVKVRWDGSSWGSSAGVFVNEASVFSLNGSFGTTGGTVDRGGYNIGVAPDTTYKQRYDGATLTYTAKRTSAPLYFTYSAVVNLSCDIITEFEVALYRDSEATAISWAAFYVAVAGGNYNINIPLEGVTAVDALSHTYKVSIVGYNSARGSNSFSRRCLRVVERA